MAPREQVLGLRVGQERLNVTSRRKLEDHEALGRPVAFHDHGIGALGSIAASMLCDEGRDGLDIREEVREVVHCKVEH